MGGSQPRLASQPIGSAAGLRPNTRRAHRKAAQRQVRISAAGIDPADATILDVSIYGCSVAHLADWLRMGRFITVEVDEGRVFQAIVRWSRGGLSGIEFLRPVAEHQIADLLDEDD